MSYLKVATSTIGTGTHTFRAKGSKSKGRKER